MVVLDDILAITFNPAVILIDLNDACLIAGDIQENGSSSAVRLRSEVVGVNGTAADIGVSVYAACCAGRSAEANFNSSGIAVGDNRVNSRAARTINIAAPFTAGEVI